MKPPIKVAIVDDHPGVRIGIRNLLADAKDIVVVGEGANGAEAIQLADQAKPDVLLLDVELPVLRGYEVLPHVREIAPAVKVLAVSSYNDQLYVQGMLENGAAGYITKDEAPSHLLEAVRSIVRDGVIWIGPGVSNKITQINLEEKTFTGRELVILRHICLGETDEKIASAIPIAPDLLKRHLQLLMAKFRTQSRTDLKRAAQQLLSTTE